MSVVSAKLKSLNERYQMYTLMEYTLNGSKVVSAIHALDLRKFLDEFPDAKPLKR